MLSKHPGVENPSDMYTKFLGRAETLGHLHRMSMKVLPGRAECAPVRNGVEPIVFPHEFEPEISSMEAQNITTPSNQFLKLGSPQPCSEYANEKSLPRGQLGLGGYTNPSHAYYDMACERD